MRLLCLSLLLCLSCGDLEQRNDYTQNDDKTVNQVNIASSPPIPDEENDCSCRKPQYEAGITVNLVGRLSYKKYGWSKTGPGWDDVDVNFFLFDDKNCRYHIVASETVPEEQLHTFVGKKVRIKALTFTQNGVAKGVYPVDRFGNPSLVRPMRFRVQEIKALENS